jgi:hypothetical protein
MRLGQEFASDDGLRAVVICVVDQGVPRDPKARTITVDHVQMENLNV